MNRVISLMNRAVDRTSGPDKKFCSAVIVAAGCGSRAAEEEKPTKQMRELLGMPVVARTIAVFEACPFIQEIIVVARCVEMSLYDDFQIRYGWHKLVAVVPGGATRQESVLNGFKRVSDRSELVYLHDGARCLVTEDMIRRVGRAACLHGAAFAAHKAQDTVKRDEGDGKHVATLDRDAIWLAQTPQVFLTEVYRAAAYTALQNGLAATDDAMLAEAAGFPVVPVDCGPENVKITYPVDFAVAEAILRYRESEAPS